MVGKASNNLQKFIDADKVFVFYHWYQLEVNKVEIDSSGIVNFIYGFVYFYWILNFSAQ